ncbi:type II secretion system F family protein [Pseudomonas sp. GD04058]|uniref:Type II secretion system protein F n=1 Tax=Pseudomonas putida TaxID=303 RepID=A0A177SUM4_PSEPU|nr:MULTISPECIES: type II secretion system F family protein [Pseudomonas]MDG9881242.1 type II secretion system F family protein [Pseudomonas sp. GD04058]OAI94645.1 type II secretion system protein F [Pseudomonas putida]
MIAVVLGLFGLALLAASVGLFYHGARKAAAERTLQRLGQLPEPATLQEPARGSLELLLLRAGFDQRGDRFMLWGAAWLLLIVLAGGLAGWPGAAIMLVLGPLLWRLYMSWRYHRRLRRMIEQLPTLLDHAVRSLKAGRTLNDAVLGAVEISDDPLKSAMQRVQRNVQMGASLDEALHDLAELYAQDEFRVFALGLRINHRYGGNASELLENLIKLIREREQGARQLRAMTGETRMTAMVLALLPICMVGYFMVANPGYLLSMWNNHSGQMMLLAAFILQVLGCVALWRMLRSI